MGNIKNSKGFAEIEYSIDQYFKYHLAPQMDHAKSDLGVKQKEELRAYQSSLAGILSSGANYGLPSDDLRVMEIRGEWTSKTTEDYLQMCNDKMTGNKAITHDVLQIAMEWKNLIVDEIGEERYVQISKELGGDLALSYIDYRVQQLMVEKMVNDKMPKSSLDYVIQKASKSSICGLLSELNKSQLDTLIEHKVDERYRPSVLEQATGTAIGVTADVLTAGGTSSWSTLAKFVGADLAVTTLLPTDATTDDKKQSVEACISKGVFGTDKNVFTEFRQEAKQLYNTDSERITSLDMKLNYKLIYPKMEFNAPFKMNEDLLNKLPSTARDPKYADVPLVVTPGQEEAYLQSVNEREERELAAEEQVIKQEDPQTVSTGTANASADAVEESQPERQNTNGWAGMLSTFGLQGFSDITKNLGFVISMLPDMLVGLFTGKTQSLSPMKNLLPLASIVGGLFVKNPILKMLMIGLGGVNLINKARHEAIQQRNHPDKDIAVVQTGRYKQYKDEALNPRIQHPLLQGNCLIATIDKVPCSIALPGKVVDAYQQGALPLNTLANAVLARNDQMSQMAQEKYDNVNAESQSRTRGIQ